MVLIERKKSMDPKDFGWTHDQIVEVVNPTAEPFRFQVYSKTYEVPAGKTVEMIGFIAWKYVNDIARQVANEKGHGADMLDDEKRRTHFEKYIVGTHEVMREVKEVEAEPEVTVLGTTTSIEAPNTGQTYTPDFEKQEEAPDTTTESKLKEAAKRVRQSTKS
jgi:hypothetical protein